MTFKRALVLVGLTAALACSDSSSATVAEADNQRLTVDQAVALLADQPQLPAQGDVIQALADLWVDYTLLATAAARDSTLRSVDLSPIVEQRIEQGLVDRLRQAVIDADTVISDEELRAAYDDRLPGASVRARHILLGFDATRAESRDSAMALAADLKARLERGGDFAQLAREYSIDPGTRANGGDLGFFDRGTMVPAFSQAAFSLEPGVISDPVPTQFGIHLIRVDERRVQPFDSIRAPLLNQIKNERIAEAEQTFIEELETRSNVQIVEDAYEAVRSLARRPTAVPPPQSANRALVSFDGGDLTLSEFQVFILNQPPALRAQIVEATDEQIRGLLESVSRGEMLVVEARRRGIELTEQARDTLGIDARVQLLNAADQLDVRRLASMSGNRQQIIRAKVETLLTEMLRGERDVIPLGVLAYMLRQEYGGRVDETGVELALTALREVRAANAPEGSTTGDMGVAPPNPDRPVRADTSGTP